MLQYYNQLDARLTQRIAEKQEPNVFAGYHHEWAPEHHTLFLGSRLNDQFTLTDSSANILVFVRTNTGQILLLSPFPFNQFTQTNHSDFDAYSLELQHIWEQRPGTLIGGARFQAGESDTSASLDRVLPALVFSPYDRQTSTDLQRFTVYGYYYWQVLDSLQLTAGLSYDRLRFPRNIDVPPITDEEATKYRLSPKAGVLWSPWTNTTLRAVYTRSLGGVFFDNSVRLEPTQIAGFNQAFRSLIPESVAGTIPGSRFETFGVALDQKFNRGTYFTAVGQILKSKADAFVGVFNFTNGAPQALPSSTPEKLDYEERSLTLTLNQLIGDNVAVGASYRLTEADLLNQFTEIPTSVSPGARQDVSATLHQVDLFVRFNYASGLFSQFDALWSQQSNRRYSPDIPGDDFWQFNAYVGYRFLQRRAEFKLGLLNITDQDYRLNPLTLYSELPRERTLAASFKFYF